MECGAMSEIQRHIPFYHCDKTPLSMQLLEEAFGMVAGDRLEKQRKLHLKPQAWGMVQVFGNT